MGDLDRICTTGFSRMSDRQVFLWDTRKLTAPIKQTTIDTSAGTLMPFFSAGQNIVFIAGKGDGNVRYYEYKDDELHPLSEYKSSDPQRGMCFLPPRSVNVGECEIARAYKVSSYNRVHGTHVAYESPCVRSTDILLNRSRLSYPENPILSRVTCTHLHHLAKPHSRLVNSFLARMSILC